MYQRFYSLSLQCICFTILILSLANCTTTPESDKEKAWLHLKIGTGHFMKKNYPLALKELLIAEKLDSNNPIIQNNLGLAYFVRDKFQLAEKHFKKSLDLNESYSEARNNLAKLYIKIKKYNLAIKELSKVTKDLTYPTPEKAYVNLGVAYRSTKRWKKSAEAFKSAIKSQKEYCPAYNEYGKLLYVKRSFNQASQLLDQATVICTKTLEEPYYYSGLSYLKSGKSSKAVARFEELIEYFPKSEFSVIAKKKIKQLQGTQ